jgi:hypothetical protein
MYVSALSLDTCTPRDAIGAPVAVGHRFLGKLRRTLGRAIKKIAGRFGIGQPRT